MNWREFLRPIKLRIIFLLLAFFFFPPTVYAGPVPRALAPDIQYFLLELLRGPFVLLLAIIGIFFHRRFILKWNFLILFSLTFVLPAVFTILGTGLMGILYFGLIILVPSLLYSTGFTVLTFVTSDIARRWKKIRSIQEIFQRLDEKSRGFSVILLYFLWIPSILLFITRNDFVYVSSILSIGGSGILLYFDFKKARLLPQSTIEFDKKDYKYLVVQVAIFIISIIASFRLFILH